MVSTERQLSGDSLVVAFEGESGGLKVTKTFTLHRGRYDIDVRHDLANVGAAAVKPSLYLQLERDGNDPADTSSFYHTFTGIAVYSEQDKFQKMTFSDIEKKKANYIKQADNGWIAIVQHYFATAWVPPQGKPRNNEVVEVQRTCTRPAASRPWARSPRRRVARRLAPVGRPAGPEGHGRAGPGLELVVDYGWLTIIAKPLFTLMTWLHSLLGNWGWTIVALTVLIKALFYPLASASYRSMARMKQVAPRLQALKEKYGDDKQKLNAAMMEMYRTEKINPLGVPADGGADPGVHLAVLGAAGQRGNARRAVDPVGARPVDPRPVLHSARHHDGHHVPADQAEPHAPGPRPGQGHDDHAAGVRRDDVLLPAGLVLYWCVNNTLSILQQWSITRAIQRKTEAAASR